MRRWFLSYHSPDQALAERLKTNLGIRWVTSSPALVRPRDRTGAAQLPDRVQITMCREANG
jgi:hypothetical protein